MPPFCEQWICCLSFWRMWTIWKNNLYGLCSNLEVPLYVSNCFYPSVRSARWKYFCWCNLLSKYRCVQGQSKIFANTSLATASRGMTRELPPAFEGGHCILCGCCYKKELRGCLHYDELPPFYSMWSTPKVDYFNKAINKNHIIFK